MERNQLQSLMDQTDAWKAAVFWSFVCLQKMKAYVSLTCSSVMALFAKSIKHKEKVKKRHYFLMLATKCK